MYTRYIERYDLRPDWLTVTGRYGGDGAIVDRVPEVEADAAVIRNRILHGVFGGLLSQVDGNFRRRKATSYYRYAWGNGKGVIVQVGSEKQGWEVITSGAFWHDFANYGQLKGVINGHKLHVTRFDWSLTIEPVDDFQTINADVLGVLAKFAKEKDGRKLPRFGRPTPDDDKETVTAGKRKSAKFMRIYDKPYWTDEKRTAIRFEMEYKKDSAPIAFQWWIDDEQAITADMMCFMYGGSHNFPWLLDGFDIDTGYPRIPSSLPRPEPDRVKYWYGNGMKGFANFANEHPVEARRWLAEALHNKTDLWSLPDKFWIEGLTVDHD